ncbi:MAG TPA: tetratricopeptide repeat protein [Phenylobacterium sp.]|nr:tetratricopeptide repeat protein [Phenylobacterium sp.]
MTAKAPSTEASALALQTVAAPARPRVSGDAIGQAGSRDALAQLTAAMAELKAISLRPILQRAVDAIHAEDFKAAFHWTHQALEKDECNGFAWYLMGIVKERQADFASSIKAYEAALTLIPEHAEVANDLGRLAFRMGMKPQAEKLFRHFLVHHPDHPEATNNLACALRDQSLFEEAIETLRPAILKNPESAQLWNTMGTVMSEQGDFTHAEVFFQEALRVDDDFYKARYNLGNARVVLGDPAGALEACEAALLRVVAEDERQMMRLARSTILMALGRVGEAWDEYEARNHPLASDTTHYLFDRPRWEPGSDFTGRSLMVVAEQGLGDEILFSNLLPDVIERLGPEGRLTLVVEPRLVEMFQRTYPAARVRAHATYDVGGKTVRFAPTLTEELESIDLWVPMGSLLREFRRSVGSFPTRVGFVTPDAERVAHWRKVLEDAPAGVKIGLLWKSGITKGARQRFFSPFEQWAPVLKAKGACFVNLQYGDCAEEIALAERDLGVRIWTPPGIDLKQDLDDVAALCCALDLVVGFSNATLNIAAACGAPTWLISAPWAWTLLGTARYPWYPQVRTFTTRAPGDWGPVMETVGEAVEAFTAER